MLAIDGRTAEAEGLDLLRALMSSLVVPACAERLEGAMVARDWTMRSAGWVGRTPRWWAVEDWDGKSRCQVVFFNRWVEQFFGIVFTSEVGPVLKMVVGIL